MTTDHQYYRGVDGMRFEWDEAKNRANARKHGVLFQDAARVFDDPDHLEFDVTEDEYGEER